jgi:hypothetical protein
VRRGSLAVFSDNLAHLPCFATVHRQWDRHREYRAVFACDKIYLRAHIRVTHVDTVCGALFVLSCDD